MKITKREMLSLIISMNRKDIDKFISLMIQKRQDEFLEILRYYDIYQE